MTLPEGARPLRILVTGAGGPLGVNVTRSLRAAPVPRWLLGTECNRYHRYLSLTDETRLIPPARELESYLEAMGKLIREERIDLLLPTHPVEVRTISGHRDRLPPVGLMLPDHQTILRADDKWRTYLLLEEAGVPVPRTFHIARPEQLEDAFEAIGRRPVWVRGSGAPGIGIGVASLPCRELEHAVAWVDHHRGWGGFIASELLPGRNLTWSGLFKDGQLIACQARERLEYVIPHVSPSGITGAPAVTRTVSEPALHRIGEAAVRALGERPHGIFFADLKEDAGGQPRVTEVNAGRFGTTIHFYTEAGFNFPDLLVRLAVGEPLPPGPLPIVDPIQPGTYWIRTLDCGPVLVTDLDREQPGLAAGDQRDDRGEARSRRLVVLDLDGTLLQLDLRTEALREQIGQLFAAAGMAVELRPFLRGLEQGCAEAAARDPALGERLRAEAWGLIDAEELRAAASARPAPGADQLLQALVKQPAAVYSNNHRDAVLLALERSGLGTAPFMAILGRQSPGSLKPSPQPILEALEAAGGPGAIDQVFMVGDHPLDMLAAVLAAEVLAGSGWAGEVVAVGLRIRSEAQRPLEEAGAHVVATSLDEVAALLAK